MQPGPSGSWGTAPPSPPPPPPPPKRNPTGLIIGALVAVVVVVVGAVITTAMLSGSDGPESDAVAEPPTAVTTESSSSGASADENDVEAAAEKRIELINTQDAVGLHRMACEADSRTESTAGYQNLFDENGPVSASIDVQHVVVNGPVGKVDGVMSIDQDSGDVTWPFKKEDGEWRFCPSLAQSPSPGSSGGDDDIITG